MLRSVLRSVLSMLQSVAWLSPTGPFVLPPDWTGCWGPRVLTDPPPGHPERLCPHIPLTATELLLRAQLSGADQGFGVTGRR